MLDRWTMVLLLLCLGLGGALALQWREPERLAAATTPSAPAPAVPAERAGTPQPVFPGLAYYDEIVERPLFVPERRQPEPVAQALPMQGGIPARYALEGTAVTPAMRVALLRDAASRQLHRVALGASVGGWEVIAIDVKAVVLRQGGQERRLELIEPTSSGVVPPQ